MEGLEEVKKLLTGETPVSWLQKTLEEELWEEEQFQQGHTPLPLRDATAVNAPSWPHAFGCGLSRCGI